ncbi:hypothetical protein [Clostridium estertheticum]|uniref:hypothetical protein n=1 Tax=Clostridium estertheticum TaxID=238834 RepID=UPI001CF22B95|nr:hypothetical protein [Clostridium estertheticum]MCB2354468.1 hypothetical protein [Clostridium estertheticum]WAG42419.1 hypothetical protein LL065_07005 [Clostridium estertheticum]
MEKEMIEQFEGIDKFISRIDKDLYFDPYGIHGISHITRVLMILDLIFEQETFSITEKRLLSYCGLYHDIGRSNNMVDRIHGINSYGKLVDTGLINDIKGLNAEELEIMRFIIYCHCMDDDGSRAALYAWNTIEDKVKAFKLYEIFKDADGLDRTKIGDLDIEYLRREGSKTLVPKAIEIYKTFQIVREEFHIEREKLSKWEKGLIEHFQYLKDKGFHDIEFYNDSVNATRIIFKDGFLTREEKEDKGVTQNLEISPLKTSSQKTFFHGTTIAMAQKIIKDGFMKKTQNVGTSNRSIDKDTIEYNKIFITDAIYEARHYGIRRSNKEDYILITINPTNYKIYTYFNTKHEFFIWGNVSVNDIKFNYYKDNAPMGELTPGEIMKLPITEVRSSKNVYLEAIFHNNMYFFLHTDPFGEYGMKHSQRIIAILQQLDYFELLPTPQKTILAYGALFHDIAMKGNEDDTTHGIESYKHIFNTGLIEYAEGLNAEELEIMKYIIECHCKSDEEAYKELERYNIKNVDMAKLLYNMFKDAEDLDNKSSKKKLRRPYSLPYINYATICYL